MGDAGLRHQAKADHDNADNPDGVFGNRDPALVLVIGASYQLVAEYMDKRGRDQQQREQRDADFFILPYLEPGRVRFDNVRPAALQHVLRSPVFTVEIGEALVAGLFVYAVAKEDQVPGVSRTEAGT